MRGMRSFSLVLAALLLLGLIAPRGGDAQARGGPPGGIAPGGPFGPGGPAGAPGSIFGHGPPPWAMERVEAAEAGLEHAQSIVSEKLSLPQKDRAATLQRADPATYELDRNGALIVRGEVIATGLDEAALARLERAGFTVRRHENLPELGLTLAVISRPDTGAAELLRQLRKAQPRGIYAPNHVMFGSGRASAGASGVVAEAAASGRGARVGLIDTAVSPRLNAPPRVRLFQHAFTAGAERAEPHGTAVAALLAARPGPVTIYAAAIFSATRGGSSDLMVSALGWLAGERVPVINISMVGPANPIVALAVETLVRKGFTIVAPVGNDGAAARPLYPASYPGVIAVSGAGADGRLLPEASRVSRVDFVAPGIARVPDPAGNETVVRGTSFAAPVVSRLLAERIAAPDPAAARLALAELVRAARKPPGDRRWSGHGLIAGN